MKNYTFDFYNSASLRSYNLTDIMRHQLSILDNMDPFTKRHSESVANLVCRICEYMHFSSQVVIHSTMCGYLHDVGKLKIPKEILNKPAKLTDDEYEIMKTHTTLGYEICMKNPELRPYAPAALNHHEALNGTGYPNGLTKKDIPYIAQIVRVADEYDALVSKRQYKTHIDISETLKILIKESQPEEHAKAIALDQLKTSERHGKISPRILKVLFRVVIDDIYYEIDSVESYIKYLKQEIKRLETAESYYNKMKKQIKEKDINYFQDGIKLLLSQDETIENFLTILQDYKNAKEVKEQAVEKLYKEIKIIKKLKV